MTKNLIRICLATTVLIATAAHAQTVPQSAHPVPAATANTPQQAPGATGDVGWVPPYGGPVSGKTRAQVYRELIQAQKDGQLAYLNSTIFAHH